MSKIKMIADVSFKILVVEDNPDLCDAIGSELTNAGFDAVCVNSGFEARDLLGQEDFDLVLCDWKLPDFGGLDLLGYVRQTLNIPFILMTGFSDFIEQQDVYASGAAMFLAKPFNSSVLRSAVMQALGMEEAVSIPIQEILKRA